MEKKKIVATIDGSEACAYSAYAFNEVAAIYPITPSSVMAEYTDLWSSNNKKNLFGDVVKVIEMQSEGGAAGAVHGALQAGALSTTFTASQGLLLMIPNIYKMVGELLPGVLHVSARSIASRALSIFGDHQDIYAARQTGIAMIASSSVQEAADLAIVTHLSAIKGSAPFIHFFDGFRTSHEIQKVELQPYEEMKKLLDLKALENFRKRALNPHLNPVTRGGAENDDIYFPAKEAQNTHFNNLINVTDEYFKKVSALTGRHYAPFVYYGDKKASRVIVAMGSLCDTISETVDYLNELGEKVGLIKVHLYRPFSVNHFVDVLPKTIKKIAILDRTKEIGSTGEPLYLDVVAALTQKNINVDVIVGGRYGLSSRDTTSKDIKSVYDNLNDSNPINSFTIGIIDDVTHLSLKLDPNFNLPRECFSSLFYGIGGDGTVSANKNSIKLIGDYSKEYKHVQAYFAYDSKKSGSLTRSHLRFSQKPIRSPYYIQFANFISCSIDSYIIKIDMLRYLKKGGTFLLNTELSKEELIKRMPNRMKKQLADKDAKFYIINATDIAKDINMGRRTNTILQSAFFYLNPDLLNYEEAKKIMKEMASTSYARSGEEIIKANHFAIEKGDLVEEIKIDKNWSNLKVSEVKKSNEDYFDSFVSPINKFEGYDLPVSTFTKFDLLDGTLQNSIAIKEKRNIAEEVPVWLKENCIQCNRCVFVCPHATIRAFILDEDDIEKSPSVVKNDLLALMGGEKVKGLKYRIQVDPKNCVGCSLCVEVCPGLKGIKALVMENSKNQDKQEEAADYLYNEVEYKTDFFPLNSVKGIGFAKPYFEASGACAGCGETPYYRLLTQLYGQDLLIANATGCSSIYSASTPSTPFVKDKEGKGTAWANSLFEDNAEYGFGMKIAANYKKEQIRTIILDNLINVEDPLKQLLNTYLEIDGNRKKEKELQDDIFKLVEASKCENIKKLLDLKQDFITKSMWIIGGDGWAYDIGYGGLDHVLAMGEDVNILVLDTEVYSNTGGQSSKATPKGSIAKFAASGKKTARKDLGAIAMTYGNVYVAQINMGANNAQTIRAIKEAESYPGPSLIIAYSPCIEHGIKGGLAFHQQSQKLATESGYFNIYRYDPRLEKPLQLDFKEPDFDKFKDYLLSESRYSRLPFVNAKEATNLIEESKKDAIKRFEFLKKLSE